MVSCWPYRNCADKITGLSRVEGAYAESDQRHFWVPWARAQGEQRVVVIKGDARAVAPVGAPSPIEVGPQGKRIRYGVRVWPVNGGMIKEELYRWLQLDRPIDDNGSPYPPGYCHFPKYGTEYFKQLTAEQLVTRVVKGYRRAEWQKTRERNEALDCRVYARAAAAVCGIDRRAHPHRWSVPARPAHRCRPGHANGRDWEGAGRIRIQD